MTTAAEGRRRHLSKVASAALAAFVATTTALAATGCSRGTGTAVVDVSEISTPTSAAPSASGASSAGVSAAAVNPTVGAATAAPTAAPASPAKPSFNPVQLLAETIARLRPGYELATKVTDGATEVQQLIGRVVGPTSYTALTLNGATVEYVQVPPNAWSRDAGGDWVPLEGEVPALSPLDALAAPAEAAAVRDAPDGRDIKAVYPPAALGVAGDQPVPVDLAVAADQSLHITYTVTVGDRQLLVQEALTPSQDLTPIAPPS